MTWQRCNGGHSSNTGHGAVMGLSIGKIFDFQARSKPCRICKNTSKKNQKPRNHDCRKKPGGSSKSMEPDVVVDLFPRATMSKIKYNVYTVDNDTTTHSNKCIKASYHVEKQYNIIHTKQSFTSRLYKLKSKENFQAAPHFQQK